MFIDFPAIVSEWVALSSLASSLKNDVLSDQHVSSIAKPVAACQASFEENCSGFAKSSVSGTTD